MHVVPVYNMHVLHLLDDPTLKVVGVTHAKEKEG
jgi:hypothetical protein